MSRWNVRSAISLFLLTSILAVVPASAEDTCPCKDVLCLAQLQDQRQSLAWMYKAISEDPSLQIKGPDGKPTEDVNLDKLTPAARKSMEADLRRKFILYDKLEAKLIKRIPAASCAGKASIAARMNPQTCAISNLAEANAAVPCKEFRDMQAAHQSFLRTHCNLGRGFHQWLTPAGLAKEQETAYKNEVKELKAMSNGCCG
jgi:hypothetical protein